MKYLLVILILACFGRAPCSSEEVSLAVDQEQTAVLKALEKEKDHLLKLERLLVEIEKGKEKADIYMRYFEKGMNSKTGWILIDTYGGDSLWLEVAFRRGFCYRQAFIHGYSAGETAEK
jgi:hypothetical protein